VLLCIGAVACTKYVTRYVPVPVVKYECPLPDLGSLPKPKIVNGCLDRENMRKLVERTTRVNQWVKEVKTRCGRSQNDLGSSSHSDGSVE
jgi:hypothetical protein